MRVACAQMDVRFGDPEANASRAIDQLERLAGEGVELTVFPEAFLTGYAVDASEGARAIAIPADHPAIRRLAEAVDRLGMIAIVGFAERDGEAVRNAAAVLEAGRPPRFYHKTHLPHLGLDRFVQAGESLPLFDTRVGPVGVLICYDQRMPEATRVLALEGAEIVTLPTNWPEGAEVSADHITIARAAENRVFYATCNRVGTENGFRFFGRSKIVDPDGRVLAAAGDGEETIVADVDLSLARQKRRVIVPGRYETALFEARRPELYGRITE